MLSGDLQLKLYAITDESTGIQYLEYIEVLQRVNLAHNKFTYFNQLQIDTGEQSPQLVSKDILEKMHLITEKGQKYINSKFGTFLESVENNIEIDSFNTVFQ